MSVVSVEHLTKDYGLGRGVFDVNFSIEDGEIFGFLGPNGAGKSTTIRHLMGFSKPDSGFTKINDKNTFKYHYEILDKVGYLPGEVALPEGLTGIEFLNMMKKLRHMESDQLTKELIEMFKLDPSGETKKMSLGQKRKLAVVAAFMHDPDILILDEPTSGLDPVMQEVFINYIINEKKRGKTILLSSHIFSEVDATCDKIAIIKDGKIVDNFVTSDLKHNKIKVYRVEFNNKQDAEKLKENKKFEIIESKGNEIVAKVNEDYTNEFLREISKIQLKDFTEDKISLQDYFMKFYKEDRTYGEVK